ncbi:PTS sugar transporter subunit IIC [Photobacterium sanguinicancri]|uniref:Permease IIC component n=1 Tax=Photobacterium sanguinicancri TaxID=875932 RepID=A0ABX4FWR3_9GAMM|nr:PTS transporter subunit EIIC [Photobacterium sanguinicancri]KXI24392.1 PTS cellobiose transporter subunit IIC [Photobacterium sanguinicancri]OZS43347.1 PTS cellobiose transporter subunit IIC [Photobacterium sanguinicancri]
MAIFDKVLSFIENVVAPTAGKISAQRHINAIKDGFVATMPFLIVGSLLLVLAFPPSEGNFFFDGWHGLIDIIGKDNIMAPFQLSMGIFALYATFGIGFSLAESYKLRAMNSGMLSMFAFLLAVAPMISVKDVGSVLPGAFLGGTGAFTAIICGLFVPEMQRLLIKYNIRIKMPEAVPPKISASFDLLIPIVFISVIVTTINVYLGQYDLQIPSAIMQLFQPLVLASDSYIACLVAVLIVQLLWFSGIHGGSVVGGIIGPMLLINLGLNQDALAAGQPLPAIFINPVMDFFIFVGGAGGTWGLVVLMMRSKSTQLKTIGKMSIVPGTFNINEPVIFGTPIVMNPVYFIPWLLAPTLNTTIVWLAFKTGFVAKIIAIPPWTMPAPIGAIIATNSGTAALVVLSSVVVSSIVFYPFLKVHEKQLLAEEKANTSTDETEGLVPTEAN